MSEPQESTSTEKAEAQIRDWILDGSLPAGTRLNEVEIATRLSLSRGPVREAIQRLLGEGFLDSIRYRGVFVRVFTPRELRDLYEARIALESYAARLACERLSKEEADGLLTLLSQTDAYLSAAEDRPYPTQFDLHATLVRLTNNPRLVKSFGEIMRLIQIARGRSARVPSRATDALREHQAIIEAVVAGDARQAQELMITHLHRAMTSALDVASAVQGD